MWKEWVIDARMNDDLPFCFCPYEDEQLIDGMNLLSDRPPDGCYLIGIFHDSEELARGFAEKHREKVLELAPNGLNLIFPLQ